MSFDLHFCLHYLIEHGGSDLHLKVPSSPVIRVDGSMSIVLSGVALRAAAGSQHSMAA